jgi:hypothetical protein
MKAPLSLEVSKYHHAPLLREVASSRTGRVRLLAVVAVALPAAVAAPPAAAADKGCDIETSSEVRVVPKGTPPSAVTTARPQTPCAAIPNGYENVIGPVGIEVRSPDLPSQDDQQTTPNAGPANGGK